MRKLFFVFAFVTLVGLFSGCGDSGSLPRATDGTGPAIDPAAPTTIETPDGTALDVPPPAKPGRIED
jgi:hypothetical protein